ncbi:MAG: deoxycytidine triphosphate deaminase [Thermoleophilia bacterium]|jgi:deoxycytidine triphosphate deaminase|nr:deoxycytidine triphosphate deaminase [Thermoleophilia bacterium]
MYLRDESIRALLPQLDLDRTPEPAFDPIQIQPASIDLRLSPVFWTPRRTTKRFLPRSLDLRAIPRSGLLNKSLWKERVLAPGESLTLRPGKLVLARIHERLAMPNSYAGKIEGRSSFARLGLMVHCTGDFINPGYIGHMPLQLYNASPYAIQLHPFMDICQLMIVPLDGAPTRAYGQADGAKYLADDGGPSFWYKDTRLRELYGDLKERDVAKDIQERIVSTIAEQPAEVMYRFERYFSQLPHSEIANADSVLDRFSLRESRRSRFIQMVRGILVGQFAIVVLGGFIEFIDRIDTAAEIALAAAVFLISALVAVAALWYEPGSHFEHESTPA